MAVNKLDPKIIFASEAPAQDTPAVFNNRTLGWGESRKNGGRPTIKQMNALQQDTELKILWLNENAVTPFDTTIDYPINAVTIKDGQFKIFNGTSWDLFLDKSSVGLNNVDNTSDLNKPISTAVKAKLDYIDNNGAALPYKEGMAYEENAVVVKDGVLQQWKGGVWVDFLGNFANKDEVKRGIANRYDSLLTYNSGERVVLANGDIVKSTIDGNTNDPNENMTGWVNFEADQQVINTSIQSNLNKYGYTSTIMNVANNVADISTIPKNSVSGKMIVRVAQYPVGIGTVGSRYYVCTSKGGNNNSYTFFELRRGVTTTTGSIGGAAELLRVTSVYEGAHAWTGRHAKYGESAAGDWVEVAYTPPGYTDANKFSRSITTGVDLWKYYQVQGTGVKFITFNTPFDTNGEANLQFYATSGSASDVNIYIDDVLYKTVSLVATTAAITRVKLEATAGYHTVKVERPTTGTVNVFGVNYSDVKDAKYGTALDGFVMWHNNVMFTNSEGANDYAIIDANSGLLGGSFHGGETLQSETYVIDGVVGNPLAAITLCKNIEIRQNTKIQWPSASMDVSSTHRFDEDSGYRLDTTFTGNVTSNTFYTAMHTTPVSYSIVSYPQYLDLSSAPDGFKKLDRSNLVVQDDPTTGKRIYSEMTLFNADLGNIYGGPAVRKVSGSYNKMYYGIAISSPQLINVTTLKSTLVKQFV